MFAVGQKYVDVFWPVSLRHTFLKHVIQFIKVFNISFERSHFIMLIKSATEELNGK